jgi:hypothetical protein
MKIALKIGMLLLFTVVSCKSNKSNLTKSESDSISDTTIVINTDTVTYQKVQEDEKEIVVNIDSVLKANINIKIEYQDSLVYVLGIKEFYDTANGQIVAFTKLKDNSELFAIVFPNTFEDENQTNVLFYMLKHDGWILVSKFDYDRVFYFEIVDINNDGVREIQSIGFPNMNGNYWNNFYSFSKEENKFIDGGGFFSSMYEFKPQVNRIEVEYGGSWYMPNTKTIYYWKNQKLIPFKKVEVGLKIADMKHNAQYIKYSENLTLEKDSVQLVYKKSFRGKKLNQFYENFFENN